MTIDELKSMKPIKVLAHWMNERESIRLKKEAGEPKPWTTDEVMLKYRFTNVRRADDAVSKWLMDNWYTPYRGHPNTLVAVALARLINRPSSLEAITDLVYGEPYDPEGIKAKLTSIVDSGEPILNVAYTVCFKKGINKIDGIVGHATQPLFDTPPRIYTNSMEMTWTALKRSYAIGEFMAGQIVADLRWAMDGEWADRMTWAPIGPGSQRGLDHLLGNPVSVATAKRITMSQNEFMRHLTKVRVDLKRYVPSSIMNRTECIDTQSCLCEYGKYVNTILGISHPKKLYPGTK